VLFITHDLSLLVEVADSIAVMYAGRIMERAGAQALFKAPRHPYSLGLIHSFPPLHGPHRDMTGIPGSPPDLRALPSGCVFHPRCGFAYDRCRGEEPPLLALPGRREAACWKQEGSVPVPPELGLPEPGYAPAAPPRLTAEPPKLTAEPPKLTGEPANGPVKRVTDRPAGSRPGDEAAAPTAASQRLRSKP
jgi:peptide/nickel transport system ATP-binding protein